jgi:hypothetical protein
LKHCKDTEGFGYAVRCLAYADRCGESLICSMGATGALANLSLGPPWLLVRLSGGYDPTSLFHLLMRILGQAATSGLFVEPGDSLLLSIEDADVRGGVGAADDIDEDLISRLAAAGRRLLDRCLEARAARL